MKPMTNEAITVFSSGLKIHNLDLTDLHEHSTGKIHVVSLGSPARSKQPRAPCSGPSTLSGSPSCAEIIQHILTRHPGRHHMLQYCWDYSLHVQKYTAVGRFSHIKSSCVTLLSPEFPLVVWVGVFCCCF